MPYIGHISIIFSVAGSLLTIWAYLKGSPIASWLAIATIVSAIITVILGTLRRAIQTIMAGFAGLIVILTLWLGYQLCNFFG